MRCAIYTRKSVEDDFRKEQTSLESQRINCEKYAQSRGWDVVPTVYEDYGRTGANIDRPGFQQLMRDIQAGQIDCVLVYKLDRLTRSLWDFVNVIEGFFKKHKVAFVSATESFDTTAPVGRLVMTILVVFAEFEREQTSLRIKDKIRTSKTNGIWTGGFIPFGYRSVERKLEKHPEEAPIVQHIYDRYVQTGSLRALARELNRTHPADRKRFNYEGLRTLIKNPIYKGYLSYKGEQYKGRHEGIVAEDVWQKANSLLQQRSVRYELTDSGALLKGLCLCEVCQRAMTPTHTNKAGKRYSYYVCLNKQKGNHCRGLGKNVNLDVLDSLVMEEARNVLRKPEIFEGFLEYAYQHASDIACVQKTLQDMDASWDLLPLNEQKRIVRSLVKRVSVSPSAITITMTTRFLLSLLGGLITSEGEEVCASFPRKGQLLVRGDKPQVFLGEKAVPTEASLLQAFLQARIWQEELESGAYQTMEELAAAHGRDKHTIERHWIFNTLSPNVQNAILSRTLSARFRVGHFTRRRVPEDWEAQDRMFGVSAPEG